MSDSEEAIFCGMVGWSQAMRRVFALVGVLSALATTVFIIGDTGTGKELVQAVQQVGARIRRLKGERECDESRRHFTLRRDGATEDVKRLFTDEFAAPPDPLR